MKFGTVAWGWTPTPEDMPCGNSLEQIAEQASKLGFDVIDYLSTFESLDGFFTQEKCAAIKSAVEGYGMKVGGFVFQSDMWNNPDAEATRKQFEMLEKCLKAATWLGAGTISCIIPGPYGARPNRRPSPSDKIASNLPAEYSWEKDWGLFAENMQKAAQLAQKYNIRIALECFPRSLCSTPDAMLKLLNAVNEPNFGIQLDTAHLANQNIDIETAIFMLGGDRIFNVHAKDSDGLTRSNLAPGCGYVDYIAVLRALHNVGYKGGISVEVEFSTNPAAYMAQGLSHMKWCIEQM